MTAAALQQCPHCPDVATNRVGLASHVRSKHPEVKPSPNAGLSAHAVGWLHRAPRSQREYRGLKRDTDTWPGRP